MALPPREDGRAHDRRQDGHRRVVRRGVPAHDAVPADVPGPLGRRGRSCERDRSRARATCAAAPNPLAADYARFRVGERLLLSGHSHQAWPDVALEGVVEAFDDAARARRREVGARVREGRRACAPLSARCSATRRAESRSGQNTHELVLRFLSALDLARAAAARHDRRRVPHAAPPARPAGGGRARRRARRRRRRPTRWPSGSPPRSTTAPRRCSSRPCCSRRRGSCPGLERARRPRARRHGAELLVDVYHALGAAPGRARASSGCDGAWVVGGGYKYLQLGEGNCFLRAPAAGGELRPVITGWYAEFDALADAHRPGDRVAYGARRVALRRRDLRPDEPLPRRAR